MEVRSVVQPNIFELSSVVAARERYSSLSLPVDRDTILYSRYKHVHGIPSIENGQGIPLYKLRALDNLIDRLIALRGNQPIVKNMDDLHEDELDGLIDGYRAALHQSLSIQSERPLSTVGYGDLGLSLDIVA